MQKIMKRSRTLLLFFAFILILAPMSTLAEAGQTKDIHYVAIGDSLTASQLYDGSIGVGFVDRITTALTESGYDVHETNRGVPGYTTVDVLAGLDHIPELATADLITISAGANDVLRQLDPLLKLDPTMLEYLLPGKVDELIDEAEEATNIAHETIDVSLEEVKSLNEAIVQVKETAEKIKEDLPSEFTFDQLIDKVDEAEEGIQAAKGYLESAYDEMSKDDVNDAIESLSGASEALTSVLAMVEDLEKDIPDHMLELMQAFKEELNDAISFTIEAMTVVEEAESFVTKARELIEEASEARKFFEEHAPKIEAIWVKMEEVGINFSIILAELQEINPDADIYVMGYYNALPYLPLELQEVTVPLLETLNMVIENPTNVYAATFVPTFEAFEGNYNIYLPNPTDIHPSEAGYEAIAYAFMEKIANQYPGFTEPVESETREISIGETMDVNMGEEIIVRETMTILHMPADLPAGTTLTITETDDVIKDQANGLQSFGDTLHFDFVFPDGFETYEGSFKLIMGYEEDALGDVNIYYFNETEEEWENKAGEVNKEIAQITLHVNHFSNYGVFAVEEVDVNPKEPTQPAEPSEFEDQAGPVRSEELLGSSSEGGKDLPKTATMMYNWMIIGGLLLLVGTTTLIVVPKREHKVG